MSLTSTTRGVPIHPIHALMLSFPVALFSSALVTDIAYLRTAEVQWTNFSAWLIAGALVFGGLTLAWALAALLFHLRAPARRARLVYVAVLAVMWVLGLVNAFKHSQDGWSSVGGLGLFLSIACTLLAVAAVMIAHSRLLSTEVAR